MKFKFDHLDDLLAHIERITADNHRTHGKWTAAQNFFHLAAAFEGSLEGSDSCDFSAQKKRLVQAIEAFRQHTQPHPPHPVLGQLTHDQWIGFHLRHCEHHLSFIGIDH